MVSGIMRCGFDAGDGGVVENEAGRRGRFCGVYEERDESLGYGHVGPNVEIEEGFGGGDVDIRDGHVVACGEGGGLSIHPVRRQTVVRDATRLR